MSVLKKGVIWPSISATDNNPSTSRKFKKGYGAWWVEDYYWALNLIFRKRIIFPRIQNWSILALYAIIYVFRELNANYEEEEKPLKGKFKDITP
jgi:hypothetical protein